MNEKIALIGAGTWGKNHARVLSELKANAIVADKKPENRERAEKEFGLKTAEDYSALIDDKSIGSFIVALPNPMHFEAAKKLLEARKNVLCEKPLALTSQQAKELMKISEKNNVVLMPGHIFRFNNALRKAKEMIASKELGEIYLAKLTWFNLDPVYPDRDVLFDLGLHPFDILHFLFAEKPGKLTAIGGRHRRNDEDETEFISCRFGKKIASIEISWVVPEKIRRVAIIGEKKSLFIDCMDQAVKEVNMETKEEKILQLPANNPLKDEVIEFISASREKRKPFVGAKEAVEVLEMLETAKKELQH